MSDSNIRKENTMKKRTFSTVMPNGMRVLGYKFNALMYKLGYEVRA
ncbi:MAG: hypothetical protein JJE49_09620 [Peptostreptococcaceae bacterium]|nr:hypothetical protein [Peptostreptococcaceae bacterium]